MFAHLHSNKGPKVSGNLSADSADSEQITDSNDSTASDWGAFGFFADGRILV